MEEHMPLGKNGFSRVELLMCMGICSVLGAAGGVGLFQYLPDYRLSAAVQEMSTVMQAARIFSIKGNKDVAVVISGGKCCEAFVDDGAAPEAIAGNGIREQGERLLCRRVFAPGVEVSKITFRSGKLRFNSRGLPRGPGSFYLRNTKGKYLGLSVSFAGSLSVKESNDGGKTWKSR
jgi:Tfp pilus assembly protein FimT